MMDAGHGCTIIEIYNYKCYGISCELEEYIRVRVRVLVLIVRVCLLGHYEFFPGIITTYLFWWYVLALVVDSSIPQQHKVPLVPFFIEVGWDSYSVL